MSDVKMILVDVKNCETKVVTPSDYKDYYKLIGCELFDIVRRHIGDNGQKYTLYAMMWVGSKIARFRPL